MNTLQIELRLLRWPLLRFGAALLLSLAIAAGAWHFMQQAAAETRLAEEAAARIHNETQRLQNEEQDMRSKIAEYQAIAARGIIGAERRLDWVELMRNIQRERKLLGLEYEIQPQMPLSKLVLAGGGHVFMNSAMGVAIPLLHEEDLLHFFSDLQEQAPAFTRLRACRIKRNIGGSNETGLPPQLMAECQIDWITLAGSKTP